MPVAILTGATGGIGAACGRMLARKEYATVLLGRNEDQLAVLQNELTMLTEGSVPCCGYAIDLRDEGAINELVQALASLTSLRLAILAAGITNNQTLQFTEEELRAVFEINTLVPMRMAKHLVPIMLRTKHPYLINIASRAGLIGFADKGVYGASKAAGIRYFDSLQAEHVDTGLRVTSICPSWVNTPMALRGGCQRDGDDILQPEDIAGTVDWLISSPPRMLVRDITIEIATTERQ